MNFCRSMKKKKDCIKHKLWGILKKKAHDYYKIVPSKDYSNIYYIYTWCYDEYLRIDGKCYTLEEAKKEIEWWRDFQFERLVDEALYYRRLEKVKNL